MTVKATMVRTCDRCSKVFEEVNLKPGQPLPKVKQKGLVVVETTGLASEEPDTKVLFAFEDICSKCEDSVDKILERLRLDAKKTKSRKPSKPRKSKKAEKVEAYTEEPITEEPVTAAETVAEAVEAPETSKPEPAEAGKEVKESETDSTKSVAAADVEGEFAGAVSEGGRGGDREDAAAATGAPGDPSVITDPDTGDVYDINTGEVIKSGPGTIPSNGASAGNHPF